MKAGACAWLLVWAWISGVCLAGPPTQEYVRDLRSGWPGVRRQAAAWLGRIGDTAAVPALLQALEDSDNGVRREAAKALGFVRDPRAVPSLIKALSDSDANVRWYAAYSLGEIKDAKAARALLHALRDPAVRCCAIRALVEIGDKRAKEPLEELAEREPHAAVRKAVDSALVEMSPRKHLVAWWSFDDRDTEVASDVSDHGNHGRILGCVPVEGKIGAALRFGKGKYIEFGQPAGLPIGGRPFTVMAWMKSDARNGVVIARGGAFCGYSLYIKDGVARFGIHRTQDGPAYIAAGIKDAVGSWIHLAGVVDAHSIRLYVNGKLAATTD